MDEALRKHLPMAQQDRRIGEAINREYARLRNFIRGRVRDAGDAEDILQEVFYELVEAYRMMERWEQMTPEEREKFRKGLRGWRGPFPPPESQTKP